LLKFVSEPFLQPSLIRGFVVHFILRVIVLCSLIVAPYTSYCSAAPMVLFDEGHAQQFLTGKSGALDLSELAALYQEQGAVVTSSVEELSKGSLSAVDVLVISGPFRPLSGAEVEAVVEFIHNGGGLAVLLHIPSPVRDLLQRLEVDYTNGTLHENRDVIDDNPQNFKVTSLAEHPLTTGLESFSLFGAWALRGTAPHSVILAETHEKSWVDLDRDRKFSSNDAAQSFGVIVAGELGRGRYVVIGDDALFQNRFFDKKNRQLAVNLVDWLSQR
jgi:hypothetical protein